MLKTPHPQKNTHIPKAVESIKNLFLADDSDLRAGGSEMQNRLVLPQIPRAHLGARWV